MPDHASFSTTAFAYDELLAGECISRMITIAAGGGELKRGTILGKDGTSGKYGRAEDPSAILVDDVDATLETLALVYVQGKFKQDAVILPDGSQMAAVRDALWPHGIYLLEVIE